MQQIFFEGPSKFIQYFLSFTLKERLGVAPFVVSSLCLAFMFEFTTQSCEKLYFEYGIAWDITREGASWLLNGAEMR